MTEETHDKALFRSTRYHPSASPNLPSDLRWAVGEYDDYIEGGFGGGQSTIGSIVFAPGSSVGGSEPSIPEDTGKPKVPTPKIRGIASSHVHQTMEGVSKADVWITVEGLDGVEYEVVISGA